jgi:hypothetical protein
MGLEENAKKAMLVFVIENVLLKIGKSSYGLVLSRMEKDYGCNISDCVDKPEYLRKVLQDIYGDASDVIIGEISEELGKLADQKYYRNFIVAIDKTG